MEIQCIKCNQMKDIENFSKSKLFNQCTQGICKPCCVEETRKRQRTPKGLIKKIYQNQIMVSKKRNHPLPAYTEQELYEWAMSNGLIKLHTKWEASGYSKEMSPSCDRKDNSVGYRLDNLELVPFKENLSRQKRGNLSGKEVAKDAIAIDKYTKEGVLVDQFSSGMCALRSVGRNKHGLSNILSVCKRLPNYKTAYGFIWRYKGDPC